MTSKKKSLSMTVQMLIGTIGGVVFGAIVGPWAGNLKFIGDIFMRLIQMSVVLLVMTSISGSVGTMEGKGFGKMFFNTLKWIIITTFFAGFLGVVLCKLIQPGVGISVVDPTQISEIPEASSIQDTLLGFFTSNIVNAMSNGSMIPCIVFSLFFGFACNKYTQTTGNRIVIDWLHGTNAVLLNIIQMVMKIAPIGIFCLLANVAGAIGFAVILPMIKYLGVLALGDLIMMLVYIPLCALRCGVNPLKMPGKFAKMSIMAITTTSSAICLPTKMEDSVTKFGVSRRVSDFIGPLAASMNSNGAALCNVAVIMFLSQTAGIELSLPQLLLGVALACMLCMGTITVPGGMAVSATFLATSLGLPVESIALILGVDWFAGMFRTLLNVDGDVIVAMLVANAEGEFDRDVYNGTKEINYSEV